MPSSPAATLQTPGAPVVLRLDGGSPLSYDRYRVNARLLLVQGAEYHPDAISGRDRMEAAYTRWRATNPRRRRPAAYSDPSGWVKAGYGYFTPDNSGPGTIAFLDLEVSSSVVRIAYMAVRPDMRGRGHARRLIQESYDRHPQAVVHWGRLMEKEMGHLYDAFLSTHSQRTLGGSRWY